MLRQCVRDVECTWTSSSREAWIICHAISYALSICRSSESVVRNFCTGCKMVLFEGSGEFGYSLLNAVRTCSEFRYAVNMNTRWSVENHMITFQHTDTRFSLIMHFVDCGNHSTMFLTTFSTSLYQSLLHVVRRLVQQRFLSTGCVLIGPPCSITWTAITDKKLKGTC